MKYTATYRKGIAYRVGPDKCQRQDEAAVIIIAESIVTAQLRAQRIAAERGWELLDVVPLVSVHCPSPGTGTAEQKKMGLMGCGSYNVEGPDDEGLYDCLDCGLDFDPKREA